MKPGWWIGILMTWMILVVICSIGEASATPFTTHHTNIVQTIMNPPTVDISWNIIASGISLLKAGGTWIAALWNTIWFNFSFLEQTTLGQYAHYLFMCIPLGLIIVWVVSLFRGASTT